MSWTVGIVEALFSRRTHIHSRFLMNEYMRVVSVAVLLLNPVSLVGQEHRYESPYVDLQEREIKALSAEEVEGLTRGEGMGMALPAELHGYPGPRHVLDLADELDLTSQQRASVRDIYDSMHAGAVALGREIVELERRLDTRFDQNEITASNLRELVEDIGRKRSDLRQVHLQAHIDLYPLLTDEQRRRYDRLRGYSQHH